MLNDALAELLARAVGDVLLQDVAQQAPAPAGDIGPPTLILEEQLGRTDLTPEKKAQLRRVGPPRYVRAPTSKGTCRGT